MTIDMYFRLNAYSVKMPIRSGACKQLIAERFVYFIQLEPFYHLFKNSIYSGHLALDIQGVDDIILLGLNC